MKTKLTLLSNQKRAAEAGAVVVRAEAVAVKEEAAEVRAEEVVVKVSPVYYHYKYDLEKK